MSQSTSAKNKADEAATQSGANPPARSEAARRYRFLLSPRWIGRHLLVVCLLGSFIALGLWQLDRLDHRKAENSVIQARLRRPPAQLSALLPSPSLGRRKASRFAYRRVVATGRYEPDREVLLEGTSFLGRPGSHVLTPLTTGQNEAVIVDRGWVPMEVEGPPVAQARPPLGDVVVTGILLQPPGRPRFGPNEPPPGRVDRLPRADLKRLGAQLPYRLYPLVLLLERQRPPTGGPLPRVQALPSPDEGPHLSYAIQWFSFAVIAAVTYAGLIRKRAAGDYLLNEPSRSRDAS